MALPIMAEPKGQLFVRSASFKSIRRPLLRSGERRRVQLIRILKYQLRKATKVSTPQSTSSEEECKLDTNPQPQSGSHSSRVGGANRSPRECWKISSILCDLENQWAEEQAALEASAHRSIRVERSHNVQIGCCRICQQGGI